MRLGLRFGVIAVAGLAFALAAGSCGSDFPDAPAGNRVQGTLTYTGELHTTSILPAAGIYAFATWPPAGPPHGIKLYEAPQDLEEGLAYELADLPPHEYFMFAQLVDLEAGTGEALAAGGYPDYCDFGYTPVTVTPDAPTEGIDIRLYDGGGTEDPCVDPTKDVDPEPGKAALVVTVTGPGLESPSGSDTITVALFTTYPPTGPPVGFSQLFGADAAFPARVVDNRVPPGSLSVSVCLDYGGDNMQCNGEGDVEVTHDGGAMLTFVEGEARALEVNLATGESVEVDL